MSGPHGPALAQLESLDALDQERLALQREEVDAPAEVARGAAAAAAAALALEERRQAHAAVADRLRARERELADAERRRTRARERISSLTSEVQVQATERELAQLGEQVALLQEDALLLMFELESAAEALAAAERDATSTATSSRAAAAAWTDRSPTVLARLAALREAIDALLPSIAAEALRAYRVGFENRGNRQRRGVTRTEGILCALCRTEIPVRWVNEARTGDGIHACGGCKRVLVGRMPDDASPSPAP